MKQDIFDAFVERILKRFRMEKEELFLKTKNAEIVAARQLLYYLCKKRKISVTSIIKYMGNNGYIIAPSSVNAGIRSVSKLVEDDRDYRNIVDSINSSVKS